MVRANTFYKAAVLLLVSSGAFADAGDSPGVSDHDRQSSFALPDSITLSGVYVDKKTYGEGPDTRKRYSGARLALEKVLGQQGNYGAMLVLQDAGGYRWGEASVERLGNIGNFDVSYGAMYYQQSYPEGSDTGDTGSKLVGSVGYSLNDWDLVIRLQSDDLESADPDDSGDEIELAQAEFSLARRVFKRWQISFFVSSTRNGDKEAGMGFVLQVPRDRGSGAHRPNR